jgi:peptidase M1-like protein/ERAP1-like protein
MAFVVEGAQACAVRAITFCAVLAGCGQPDTIPTPRGPTGAVAPVAPAMAMAPVTAGPATPIAPAGAIAPAPGPRLPEGVTPLAYDLTLELDPDRASFTGHVVITIAVAAPRTTQLWLHAVDLEITSAQLRIGGHDEHVALLPGGEQAQMRGFALPYPVGGPVGGETVRLVIDYTGQVTDLSGRTGKDTEQNEEGLFRERAGGRWYLYAQAESVFARKILPCFDEPRWKPAWLVTMLVPAGVVAVANAPMVAERTLPDGRREARFAEIAALPSYLFAIAVGPFDVVDAGKLGRARMPVRIIVPRGDGKDVAPARDELPKIIDAVEGYVDAPLPLRKLDLVAVPQFFGAMENVGLITFERAVLVGGREFVVVAAHELAHQWFGNAVTPAWWEHLWLSEAFATWLGERVAGSLGEVRPPVLAHRARARALWADEELDVLPLVHPIATSEEIEPAFDAIAYEKGGAVLAMFEGFVGEATWQAAVRAYLAAHARTSVTSAAFIEALARATSPVVGAALASNLVHAGAPVVELAVRCGAAPAVVASARDGVAIPVCVRFPATATAIATTRACFLAGPHLEYRLPAAAGCPAWVAGNDGGRGYYRIVWRGGAPRAPLAMLSPEERLAQGDDAALAVRHGELPVGEALAELAALARTGDPYGELAALSIAREIDPLVADPERPVWTAWLAGRFADRLTPAALSAPRSLTETVLRRELVALARAGVAPETLAAAGAELARGADHEPGAMGAMLRVAVARDPEALFARIVAAARTARTPGARGEALEDLGAFPAAYAPRIVDLLLDRRFAAGQIVPALVAMVARGETATAAWRAIHDRFAAVFGALTSGQAQDVLTATAALCEPTARAEVDADFAPHVAAIDDGPRRLAHALAAIDRCLARRAAAGSIANALAADPAGGGRALTPRP